MTQFQATRHDHFIPSSSSEGPLLRVREVSPVPTRDKGDVIIFIHGAVMHSILFDIPVPGASWQEYFAGQGYHTFSLDMRGYGRSTRPKTMDLPAKECPFTCTHEEALEDIFDVV